MAKLSKKQYEKAQKEILKLLLEFLILLTAFTGAMNFVTYQERETAKVLNVATSTVKYRLREVLKILKTKVSF